MNWGNIIGLGAYLLLLSGAILKIIKDRKAGKSKCSACPSRDTCMRNVANKKQ